jgi:hypothetical protein
MERIFKITMMAVVVTTMLTAGILMITSTAGTVQALYRTWKDLVVMEDLGD